MGEPNNRDGAAGANLITVMAFQREPNSRDEDNRYPNTGEPNNRDARKRNPSRLSGSIEYAANAKVVNQRINKYACTSFANVNLCRDTCLSSSVNYDIHSCEQCSFSANTFQKLSCIVSRPTAPRVYGAFTLPITLTAPFAWCSSAQESVF